MRTTSGSVAELIVVLLVAEELGGQALALAREGELAGQAAGDSPADEGSGGLPPGGVHGEPEIDVLLRDGAQAELAGV